MNLDQLRYFQAAAKENNLTRVAGELNLTQQAVSSSIASLETELGCRLFDRERNKIHLNENGECFLKYAEIILEAGRSAVRELEERNRACGPSVSVASTGMYLQAGYIAGFKRRYPEVAVKQQRIPAERLSHYVLTRPDIDVIFSAVEPDIDGIEAVRLEEERWCLLAMAGHPLALKESVSLREAEDASFVFPPAGFYSHDIFYDLCAKAGFSPRVEMECFSEQMPDLILCGNCVTIVPETETAAPLADPAFRKIPLTDDFCLRQIYLLTRKNSAPGRGAKLFLAYLRERTPHK